MRCPICKLDLTPLDLVSRTEHVDLCIENGPSVVDVAEDGRLVIKRSIPANKQRKICPICDKTFQAIHTHFKTCALRNDLPPNLMLDYWDQINAGTRNPRKFPRELLDGFVAKAVREGRVGDQVDFARALSLSMAGDGGEAPGGESASNGPILNDEASMQSAGSVGSELGSASVSTAGVHNADHDDLTRPAQPSGGASSSSAGTSCAAAAPRQPADAGGKPTNSRATGGSRPKFRLELADDETKRANIRLRIERELAASRSKRYEEALQATSSGQSQ